MKQRNYIVLGLIIAVLTLLTTCNDPDISRNTQKNEPNKIDPQKIFTVSFQANGGNPSPVNQVCTMGAMISEPSIMSKYGYSFGGWFKEKDLINQWDFSKDVVLENVNLYAKWNPNTYTVIFIVNGGNPAPEQQNISYYNKVVTPHIMHKTGFGFGGWFKEPEFINQWDFHNDIITENITLYAMWDINFHTVSFESNGGSITPEQQEIAHGSEAIIPSDVNKIGYGLVGWFKEPELINLWDFNNNKITENITLYAKWDINFYTVNFNANSVDTVPQQQNIAHGGKITEPQAMNRTGYTFGGWYKEATFINQWNFSSDIITSNITLYAKWNIIYHTVNFEVNGGNPTPQQQSIAYGGKATQPSIITKTGYTFDGWYKEETLTNRWNFSTDIVTSNITLYAKWLENFTVTFEANGGNPIPAQQSISPSGKATYPVNINKNGFAIAGWFKEDTFINLWNFTTDIVTSNITLYAKWYNNETDIDISQPVHTSFIVNTVNDWNSAITVIRNGGDNKNYIITVTNDLNINGYTVPTFGYITNIIIVLRGDRTISLTSNGNLLRIINNQYIIVKDLTLRGISNNNSPLVLIDNSSAKLEMKSVSKITENSSRGVLISSGTLVMRDNSSISYNTSNENGAGVAVQSSPSIYNFPSTLLMYDNSSINNNIVSNTNNSGYCGGGVYVHGTFGPGRFFMYNNSTVTGNTLYAPNSTNSSGGGGVGVDHHGFFQMYDNASVSRNTATVRNVNIPPHLFYGGGGIFIDFYSRLIMRNNSSVYGNTTNGTGGGILINLGNIRIESGTIFGNELTNSIYRNFASDANSLYFFNDSYTYTTANSSNIINTAEYGLFDINDNWTRIDGLPSGNSTIRIEK